MTAAFVAADTLTISGLKLMDLHLAPSTPASFELDFTGDSVRDAYDLYTIQVRAQWSGGSYDGWDRQVTANYTSLTLFAGTVYTIR